MYVVRALCVRHVGRADVEREVVERVRYARVRVGVRDDLIG